MIKEICRKIFNSCLSESNLERTRIISRCFRELKQSFKAKEKKYPVSPDEIRSTLIEIGITAGDVVMVHSSAKNLFAASDKPPAKPIDNIIQYSGEIIDLLIDLVGEEGTILMNTDSIKGWPIIFKEDFIFDYTRLPSRRGWVTELFRRRNDVIRSVHPWCNVSAWGKMAKELLKDHHTSTPYAMDKNSPWYKLTDVNGKILLLGVGFEANTSIILQEHLHPEEVPYAVFFNKPYKVKYKNYNDTVMEMDIHFTALHSTEEEVITYLNHIDEKYKIYKRKELSGVPVICFYARDQYQAMYQELKNNNYIFDLRVK